MMKTSSFGKLKRKMHDPFLATGSNEKLKCSSHKCYFCQNNIYESESVSRTTGKKIARDDYPTPIPTVDALLSKLHLRETDLFLEPCRGAGNIFDRINLPAEQKSWAEVKEGVNYLETTFLQKDVIITNPPFSLTTKFLKKSLSELAPDGTLAYLQRVNFLGSLRRVNFWREIGFPNKTPIIIPRPRFVNGGSDSCEYMWMIWDKGNRFENIPHGISHIISE